MIHVSKLYIIVQILTNPIYYPKYRTQFIQPPSPSLKSIIKSNERNKREQELENQSSKIERGEQLLSEQNLRKRENRATFQIAKLNNANDRFDLFEGQRFPFYHSSLSPSSPLPLSFPYLSSFFFKGRRTKARLLGPPGLTKGSIAAMRPHETRSVRPLPTTTSLFHERRDSFSGNKNLLH